MAAASPPPFPPTNDANHVGATLVVAFDRLQSLHVGATLVVAFNRLQLLRVGATLVVASNGLQSKPLQGRR